MILGAVFCPHPPALVPELSVGAASELADLRAACVRAIGEVTAPGRRVVILGAGQHSRSHGPSSGGNLRPYGVDLQVTLSSLAASGPGDLPLSLTIGAWLLRSAGFQDPSVIGFSVGSDFGMSEAQAECIDLVENDAVSVLVMGDGSARRSTSAPGYLDDRAAEFDAVASAALSSGEPASLARLDSSLGATLLSAGVPVWQFTGRLLAGQRFSSRLDYDEAPYGVGYFVARWLARG